MCIVQCLNRNVTFATKFEGYGLNCLYCDLRLIKAYPYPKQREPDLKLVHRLKAVFGIVLMSKHGKKNLTDFGQIITEWRKVVESFEK